VTYGLVIFDCDGVLVDSETISNLELAAYLTELGHPTTYEDSIRDYMGGAMHRVHETVLARSGQALPANFDDAFHARVFAAFERELRAVEGVSTVLDAISRSGVATCVASSGSHERIRFVLKKTGLYERFGEHRLFSSDDVGRGKPAPDLFLHAAASLGFEPPQCAVVEDSPLGIAAAIAAEMAVFGFAAMTPPEKLAGATAMFERMDQLLPLLFA
jgi:HAD superfamily hydrolase (TIGR01509 family)